MSDTRQLEEWRGAFGNAYTERNAPTADTVEARVRAWRRIFEPFGDAPPASILEVGANVGVNLRALKRVSDAALYAVEPNAGARQRLVADGVLAPRHVIDGDAAAIAMADAGVDLVFTSGVLIHVAPDDLLAACRGIHRVARRWVLSIEYFAAVPEEVRYRDRDGLLYKRDFGAFWLDNFADLVPCDYGFFWKRATGLDDLTWWLFRKQ